MTEENFSPQESLRLIQSMIDKTKENISDNSRYFLLWGWLTFFACLTEFILKDIMNYDKHYRVWWIVIPGFLYTIYFGIKDGRKRKVRTFIDESMGYLWTGMGVSFFVLSFIISNSKQELGVFPFFIMLYGLGTFVSGCFLKFKPLIIGGIIAWIIAVGSVFLSYDYQLLAGGCSILVSYIIPGHLLRRQNQPK